MGFVADVLVESPNLGPIFDEYQTLELTLEDVLVNDQPASESSVHFYFWASDIELEEFTETVASLPNFSAATQTTSVGDRSLVRLTIPEERRDATPYSLLSEYDITILQYRLADGEARFKARYPDRKALAAMREWFTDRDLSFRLQRVYTEEQTGDEFDLTEKQHEALVAAWKAGYYRTPREATLEEVAADLGITQQSLSERLKRGLDTLLEETIVTTNEEGSVVEPPYINR